MPRPQYFGVAPDEGLKHPAELAADRLVAKQLSPTKQRQRIPNRRSTRVAIPVPSAPTPSGLTISASTPAALTVGGAGSPGSTGFAQDAGHTHPMPGAFVAAGGSHAAGFVPDPGSTTHSPVYVLGDDSAFHNLAASAWTDTTNAANISSGTLPDARLSFKRCVEWSGPDTLATGADTCEITLPADFSSRTLQRVHVRLKTASGSGSFALALELSTASGAFSVAQTSDTFTLTAGTYETIATSFSSGLTGSAGNKIRFNISSLGSGAAGLTILTEWR